MFTSCFDKSIQFCLKLYHYRLSISDLEDSTPHGLAFYYCRGTKDLQLSPPAESSSLSPAKSFEVILAERKTLVHKPCQALHQRPSVKLILISTFSPPPLTLGYLCPEI